jgi:hypothetical protein
MRTARQFQIGIRQQLLGIGIIAPEAEQEVAATKGCGCFVRVGIVPTSLLDFFKFQQHGFCDLKRAETGHRSEFLF